MSRGFAGYPSLASFAGKNMRAHPGSFVGAPWFDVEGIRNPELWRSYLDADRVVPGGIPERALESYEWRQRVVIPRGDMIAPARFWSGGKWLAFRRHRRERLVAWIGHICDKLELMDGPVLPRMLALDLWRVRTPTELPYALALAGIRGLVGVWSGMGVTADVHRDAILWTMRQLPVDYQTAKKATMPFWSDTVRYERRCRSAHGYFIPYHNVEVESWAPRALGGHYVRIPGWWRDWEVPAGCWAELPPALAYIGSALITDMQSAWWVAVCTGWAVNVAMYLVWDSYDTRRLWWIPPRLRVAIRAMPSDAMRVMMGEGGYSELVRLLDVIDRARWDDVPAHQHERPRDSRRETVDHSPGGRAGGADYMYIDPATGNPVDAWVAKRRRAGMYAGDSPWAAEEGHRRDGGIPPDVS